MQQSLGYMRSLAYLYDNIDNFPSWVKKLAPGQLMQLAKILTHWAASDLSPSAIVPLHETQKREVIRAVIACQGDLREAAKALGIGKTTIYRLLHKWGLSRTDWRLVVQARVLANDIAPAGNQKSNALTAALERSLSAPVSLVSRDTSTSAQNSSAERRK